MSGYAHSRAVRWKVARDNGPRANGRIFPNVNARKDDATRPQ